MLFKKKYFQQIARGIAEDTLKISQNSSLIILILADIIAYPFSNIDAIKVSNFLEKKLVASDLIAELDLPLSVDFKKNIESPNFQELVAKFFDYYHSRLPVFKKIKITHRNGKKYLSDEELDQISHECFLLWAASYPELIDQYKFSGDYSKIKKLTKWYVRHKTLDDEVYNIEWLWETLENLYPEHILLADKNMKNFTFFKVIEACFPMFWNVYIEHYKKGILLTAALGWFEGDSDTDELLKRIKN